MAVTENKQSIAIAGAWGYIGQKFIEAARFLQYDISVYDPGPVPDGLDLTGINRVEEAKAFYGLDANLFHLALHPEHRASALDALLPRSKSKPLHILNEKPMASPESPEACSDLIDRVAGSRAVLLFDFPELFDPITARIFDYLDTFQTVEINEVRIQRSKDREDRTNLRNEKKMVPIQFQETVHCLAFLLNLVGRQAGSVEEALSSGLTLQASSDPYDPPNPDAYSYVVDGRCDFDMRIGRTSVIGHTDFKRNASWRKERIIRGVGDGQPFEIQVDFLEGAKYLSINQQDQAVKPWSSSYVAVLDGYRRLAEDVPADQLMQAVYPNAAFARYTYQLSSVLWRACREGEEIGISGAEELLRFDARFAEEVPRLGTYPIGSHG
jgi:predicted dehydrogenase